jgi:PTH1 family peptidyl-tRNA hydrolase
MKLIVGLGNPGKEYENTRHNIGFMVLDSFLEKYNITGDKKKFSGIYYEYTLNNEKYILLKPQKYMNLSGEVVRDFVNFFKISIEDILIISDDLDMETGKIKLKLTGSCGGHNGLRNIEEHLNTKDYKRLKIGIANNKLMDTKDYVLGKFTKEEKEILNDSINKGVQIIEEFSTVKFDNIMNKYN